MQRIRHGVVAALLLCLVLTLSSCSGDEERQAAVAGSQLAGDDPCSLFTQQEVARIIGAQIERAEPTGAGRSCSYQAADSSVRKTLLLLTVEEGDTPKSFSESVDAARKSGDQLKLLDDVGDEAFTYSGRDGRVHSADARLGDTRVRVLIEGLGGANSGSIALRVLQMSLTRLQPGTGTSPEPADPTSTVTPAPALPG